jgi:predicted dehydrogenase
MTILKGGVVGFGNIGQGLTHYINGYKQDDARIVAACNRGKANLDLAREKFGLEVTHDMHELADMDLDFVLVVSTSHVHAEQVVIAAEAGLHVFCEKPIALNLEDAVRMIEAVESAGVVNVVNYSMRYIDAYLKIKELVDSGKLGRLLSICHYKTRAFGLYSAGARHKAVIEPEESGGWTVHHACHGIDFLYWINGPITQVYAAMQTTVPDKDSEEVVLGSVVFENGAIGHIGDSVCCIRDHYTQIIGTEASLVLSGEHEETELRLHRESKGDNPRQGYQTPRRRGGPFPGVHQGGQAIAKLTAQRAALAGSSPGHARIRPLGPGRQVEVDLWSLSRRIAASLVSARSQDPAETRPRIPGYHNLNHVPTAQLFRRTDNIRTLHRESAHRPHSATHRG